MFPYTRYLLLIVTSVFFAFSIEVSASPRVEVIATGLNRLVDCMDQRDPGPEL